MTKRATYDRTMYVGNVVQVADDLGHVINPAQDDAPDEIWVNYPHNVGIVAVELTMFPPGGIFPNRQSMTICNLGPNTIYIGKDALSASLNFGFPIFVNQTISLPFGSTLRVWAIAAAGVNNVRIMELFA